METVYRFVLVFFFSSASHAHFPARGARVAWGSDPAGTVSKELDFLVPAEVDIEQQVFFNQIRTWVIVS